MTNAHLANIDAPRTSTAVQGMLRDIGYVLWLTRKIAADIESQKCERVRPDMSEYCEFDAAAFAV